MPNKFIKKCIFYPVCWEKMGHSWKPVIQWAEVSKKLMKPFCTRGTRASSGASGWGAAALEWILLAPQREKISSQELKPWFLQGPGPSPSLDLRTRSKACFALWECLGTTWIPTDFQIIFEHFHLLFRMWQALDDVLHANQSPSLPGSVSCGYLWRVHGASSYWQVKPLGK